MARSRTAPRLILREMPPLGDVLICGISTQVHQRVPDFDEIIEPQDPDYVPSSLKEASLVRLGFLAVRPRKGIYGKIGSISPSRHNRLLGRLAHHLVPTMESDRQG